MGYAWVPLQYYLPNPNAGALTAVGVSVGRGAVICDRCFTHSSHVLACFFITPSNVRFRFENSLPGNLSIERPSR